MPEVLRLENYTKQKILVRKMNVKSICKFKTFILLKKKSNVLGVYKKKSFDKVGVSLAIVRGILTIFERN